MMKALKALLRHILPERLWTKFQFAYLRNTRYKNSRKRILSYAGELHIVYALTPPPSLPNVGDHAQAVAIRDWLTRNFSKYKILELDKNEVLYCMPEICSSTGKDDPVFLHSGGNLGDRGKWSEKGRRLLIENLHDSAIFSLPQTIFFSGTPDGNKEREITREIYGKHPSLLIAGRDRESGALAKELFPKAATLAMPDFVLSLAPDKWKPSEHDKKRPGEILCCLRNDDESILSDSDRSKVESLVGSITQRYDTTLKNSIQQNERIRILRETLAYFNEFDAVVTDRYHGLIFSLICCRPTVVLRTVDHKLTSAFDWFKDIPFVKMADSLDQIPKLLNEVKAADNESITDWNKQYFDILASKIQDIISTRVR